MTNHPKLPTLFVVRLLTGLLTLSLFVAAVAGLSVAADPEPKPPAAKPADKPARPPEDEETNPRPAKTHKITVPEGNEPAPKSSPAPRPVDLRQAARDAQKIPVHNLFNELAVPHDVMTRVSPSRTVQNIVPISDYIGSNTDAIVEPFTVTPYPGNSWTPGDPIEVK